MAVQKDARKELAEGPRKAPPSSAGTNPAGVSSVGTSKGPSRRSPGPHRPAPGRLRTTTTVPSTAIGDTSSSVSIHISGTSRGSSSATAAAAATATATATASSRSHAGAQAASRAGTVYRYLVLPGNESVLLREALMRRSWWEPVQEEGGGGNGSGQRWNLWAGLNGQRFNSFELLRSADDLAPDSAWAAATSSRLVNRLQEHRAICTKSGLAGVLAAIQAATTSTTDTTALPTAVNGPNAAANPPSIDSATPTRSASSEHGSSSADSGSGSGSGVQDTSWIPETYVVPAGPKGLAAGSAALARFKAAYAAHAAEGRRVWIAKPTSLNRGNGIEVFGSLDQILDHIKSRPAGSSLILQKYIERPLLLGGRKFDIRAYVLVGPDGTVWFHKEAYCRTSSTPYDSTDLGKRSAHLTNDAVQKHLDTYNAFEDHCKLSLEELGPALRRVSSASTSTSRSSALSSPPPDLDTTPGRETGLWGAMRRCVVALFSAAGPLLNPRRLAHCFELLGLDFMLDAEGRVYLIEVNTSPALFRAGAYLSDLLPRLVEELVQKVVDPLFPPPSQPTTNTATTTPTSPPLEQEKYGTTVDAPMAGSTTNVIEGAAPGVTRLDSFVRMDLDERLGAAVAARMARSIHGDTLGAAASSTTRIAPAAAPAPVLGSGFRSGSGSAASMAVARGAGSGGNKGGAVGSPGRVTAGGLAAGRVGSGAAMAAGGFGARQGSGVAPSMSPTRRALRLSDRR